MPKIAVIAIKHPTEPNLYLHGLRRDNGKWALAAGSCIDGETDYEGATRELEEETGLTGVKLDKLANQKFGDNDVHLYSCNCPQDFIPNSDNDPDSEFLTFKWLDPTAHDNMHVPARNNILIKYLKGTLSKTQQDEIEYSLSYFFDDLSKSQERYHPDNFDIGDLHPEKEYVCKLHAPNLKSWYSNENLSTRDDSFVDANKASYISGLPDSHKDTVSKMISAVRAHGKRHAVPGFDVQGPKRTWTPRVRHMKHLIRGDDNAILDLKNDGSVDFTLEERHGSTKDGTSWNYHPKTGFKFLGRVADGKLLYRSERSNSPTWRELLDLTSAMSDLRKTNGSSKARSSSNNGNVRPERLNEQGANRKASSSPQSGILNKSEQQNLIHYSSEKGLKTIHPEKMGSGVRGLQYKRGLPENKSSFYYTENSKPEEMVTQNAQSKYIVKMPQNVYDFSKDLQNFHQKVLDTNQRAWNEDLLHGLLKQHGYAGVQWSMNPETHVVQLYHPQTVHAEYMLKSENLNKAENEETNTLMNRVEDKYFLPRENLEKFTSELRERLKGGDGDTSVRYNVNQSIYFDSQDMDIFRDAMDKVVPRFKLRIRRYAPSGELWENTAYLELKMKTKDGMTKKVRIRIPASIIPDLEKGNTIKDTSELEKLNTDIPKEVFWKRFGAINGVISKFGVKKQIKVVYSRRAYSNDKLRVTIDEDLRYLEARAMSPRTEKLITSSSKWNKIEKKHLKVGRKDYLIVEVKHQEGVPDWLKDLLDECNAKEASFSKYCASIVAFINNGKESKGAISREHKVDTDSILADIDGYETIEKSEKLYKNSTHIKNVADHYAKLNGINLSHNYNVNLNPEHGKIIASAYESMLHQPNNTDVKAAYGALIGETGKQFKHLISSGLKISRMEPGQENPYKSSKDMLHDLHNNNHLWYYPTEQGFGAGEQEKDHPMLKETEFKHNGKPLLANDVFRIVHDAFGHGLTNSTFGPKGEHMSYLAHKEMFSPLAQKALASETMGQNSTVNFGKNAAYNKANPENTIYAEQKAGLLPEHIINGKWHE